MTQRKHALPVWRHAAAGALVLSLSLAGLKTAQAADVTAIGAQGDFPGGSVPAGLIYGPGQSLWVSLSGSAEIGQIPLPGSVSLHSLPDFNPWDVTLGPDQALWLTEKEGDHIGRLTPRGEWEVFPLGDGAHAPTALALGQDRALWFTERDGNRISRLTPAGELTQFDLPITGSRPSSIISAPNGNLWFTEWDGRIGKITLQGAMSEYPLPAGAPEHPSDLLIGSDGIVWVMFNTGKTIARFDPQSETFTLLPVGTISASLSDLTLGPDNRIWFIGTHSAGSFDLAGGVPGPVTEDLLVKPVFDYQGRSQIVAGPDNDLFFTTANANTVYRSPQPGSPALRDLQVFVTYHPPVILSAGPFNIDAEIVNWTNTDATDVEIHLTLDESIHFVSADVPGGACIDNGLSVDCTLATLAAGATLPVSFVMTTERIAASPVERALTLEAASAEGDYKPADNRVVLFTTIQTSLDYFNDFSFGADAHWSQPVTSTPAPGLDVLGLFDNDDVIFDWRSLPPHDQAWVCFDLYVSGPWSGSQYLDPEETTIIGPDLWTNYLDDNRLLLTTFSNQQLYQQAYPANYPGALSAYQTGSVQAGEFDGDPSVQDARYSFCYQREHRNLSLELLFKGLNLNAAAREQWSLDNVRIKILYDASIDRTYLPLLRR